MDDTPTTELATQAQGLGTLQSLSFSQAIDVAIASLTVEAPRDVVLEQLMFADSIKRIGADAHSRISDAAAAWIKVNGEIECNGVRYYVGPKKVTKCADKGKTLDALIVFCGGDMSAAAEFLSSEPFKHGSIGKELPPEQFAALFTVTYEDELKEGKPKLNKVDTKFLR